MAGICCGSSVGREADEPSVPLATGAQSSCVAGQAGRGQPGLAAEQPSGLWGVSATDNIPLKAVFVKFVVIS